ncbi:MAG: dTMP kinase [Actinomycetota bacterium]
MAETSTDSMHRHPVSPEGVDSADPGEGPRPEFTDNDPRPDHDVRAVLAIAPFRRLWLALGLSSFGDWLGLLATTALAATLPESPAAKLLAVSGVFIIRLAPAVLLGPLAGVFADRLPRRWTLVAGDVLRCLLFASIPFVGTLWWLYLATFLVEIIGLFWLPAKDATVPNLIPRRRLETANQLSLIVTYGTAPLAAVAFIGATLMSGIVDGVIGQLAGNPTYLALYLNAATFLTSAVVIWRLAMPDGPAHAVKQEPIWRTAVEGWQFIRKTPLVRGLVVGMLGAFAAGGVAIGLAQVYVTDLRAGPPGYSTLFGAVFVGMAAGMWCAPRWLRSFSRRRLFGLSIAVSGGWLLALALIPNVVLAVFFTAGLGASAGAAWVTGYTMLGLEVGDEIRGRTFAFVQSLARVVLVSVLAAAPILAAGFSAGLGLPRTVQLTDRVALTYTGVMVTFLLAGIFAVFVGVRTYRRLDDQPGVSLRADLREALWQRVHPEVLPHRVFPGRFIALEGGDGAGKSTQAELLGEWLQEQGYDVVLTREPGATELGENLRDVVLHGDISPRAEALLFAADRAQHVESVIRPALTRGAIVVSDRYVDSSVAYQGAGRELGVRQVAEISRWATESLVPDITVLLDVDPVDAQQRRSSASDRLESQPEDFHGRVHRRFLKQVRRAPFRYHVVDAALGPQEVHRQIVDRVSQLLPESPVARAEREVREAAAEADQQRQQAAAEAERAAREAARRAAEEARVAREAENLRRSRVEEDAKQERARRDENLARERARHESMEHRVVSSAVSEPGSPSRSDAPTDVIPVVREVPAGSASMPPPAPSVEKPLPVAPALPAMILPVTDLSEELPMDRLTVSPQRPFDASGQSAGAPSEVLPIAVSEVDASSEAATEVLPVIRDDISRQGEHTAQLPLVNPELKSVNEVFLPDEPVRADVKKENQNSEDRGTRDLSLDDEIFGLGWRD